jgi:hypothetical protein
VGFFGVVRPFLRLLSGIGISTGTHKPGLNNESEQRQWTSAVQSTKHTRGVDNGKEGTNGTWVLGLRPSWNGVSRLGFFLEQHFVKDHANQPNNHPTANFEPFYLWQSTRATNTSRS